MPDPCTVRRVTADEWEAHKRIRLASLREDPPAFGSTLERELDYPDERWQETVRRDAGPGSDAAFHAFGADVVPVGLGGVYADTAGWHVVAMWVEPAHRRRGVGRALLEAIVAHAQRTNPSLTLDLHVNTERRAARSLYESAGFRGTGDLSPLGHHPPAMIERMVWVDAGRRARAEVGGRSPDRSGPIRPP